MNVEVRSARSTSTWPSRGLQIHRIFLKNPFAIRPEGGEDGQLMSLTTTPDQASTPPEPADIAEQATSSAPKPIAEFASRADFPKCAVGEFVDIGGFAGILVEIVNQSIKVKSPEGFTQSFNFNRLRTIYGPKQITEPVEMNSVKEQRRPLEKEVATAAPAPKREFIEDPDFSSPVKPITDFAGRSDFPKCVYGAHIDIAGYPGVVVEIVNQSVKVRSMQGVTRSYNAPGLRKLYGQG